MSALLALLAAVQASDDAGRIGAFLRSYCIECHGPTTQKAERRFDGLRLPAGDAKALVELQEILDQLNLGQMPPKKARQPSREEARAAVEALTRGVADGHARLSSTGGRTVLRRLNRREYRASVGDLFGIDMTLFDPTASFPRDGTALHLDTIGDALATSGHLLDQYLEAADRVVEKAFRSWEPVPERSWVFKGPWRQQPELDRAHEEAYGQKWMSLYECMQSEFHEGSYGTIRPFSGGVPADGFYEIRVRAEAVNRRHPYDPRLFAMDPEDPFRLGIVPGDDKAGPLHQHQPIEPLLGEVVLGDDGPEWHTLRVRLDAGITPRFTFSNGQINIRRVYGRIVNGYPQLLPEAVRKPGPGIVIARKVALRYGKMPHVRIHEVHVRGPLPSPRASHPVLGDAPFAEGRTREILERFASRAYRRPPTPAEVERLVALAAARRASGRSPLEALKDAIKAVLCSPSFLYLAEPEGELPSHALGARLSYFLWSTLPDDELRGLADRGELARPEVLASQVRRLLADTRSDAFLEGFLDGWLNLRALGDMPPDRAVFPLYYQGDLQNAMKRETRLFVRHLIAENRPFTELLSADYTFANRPLARLYGVLDQVPPKDGQVFRRVIFRDPSRGGLLGQGSVLTVSANGIETSPVTRGVWLLENILGTKPAPPPDDVPSIDPDIRGAASMRDLFLKHRRAPACYECHRKIDPLGFALENFDPIGGWRSEYKRNAPIDASGELPGGETFRDAAGLKKILAARREMFGRAVVERLLAYACGRRMEVLDRPRIDRLLEDLGRRGDGMRDLLEQAVLSTIFRSK